MSNSAIHTNQNLSPLPPLPPPNPAILAFHRSLPHYSPTPLISLPEIAQSLGIRHVLLKDESNRLGLPAFKILGASWATAVAISTRLSLFPSAINLETLAPAAQTARFVLYAATEGNHGRAVARIAKYLGIKARIYVPAMSDETVKANLRSEGAEVVVWDGSYDDAVMGVKSAAEGLEEGKGLLISDTALVEGDEVAHWIVEGYQTMFNEVEEQIKGLLGDEERLTHVFTPVGVGSLAQAVVTHFRRGERLVKPDIVAVESEEAACLKASLENGNMVSVDAGYTICSGMCCGTLSVNAWPILERGVSKAVAINDIDVEKALFELAKYDIKAGPCGSATLAGLRTLGDLPKDSVVLLLCTEGARPY